MSEQIILEKVYDKKGKYLGMFVVYKEEITPQFIKRRKEDKDDELGWHRWRKVMKAHGHNIDPEDEQ